jgi:hypothetical protein
MSVNMISSEEAKKSNVDVLLEKLSATKKWVPSTEVAKRLQIYSYN